MSASSKTFSSRYRPLACWLSPVRVVHLRLDLLLNLPGQVVARGLVRPLALAQDEQDGALDVAAFAQSAVGFGDDIPGGGDLQAGRPDDVRHVRPDGLPDWCVNMTTCMPLSGMHSVMRR